MSDWKQVALGEVATIARKTVEPKDISDDTTYVGLENIARGGTFVNVGTVGEAALASTKFRFTSEQILFGKLRPYLAKIARPSFSGVCSTDILPISPGNQLDRGYLAHFLIQPKVVEMASSRATGANLPRLSPAELAKFTLPLPPLDEQRRIAEVLDRTDELLAKRREALAHLDDLIQCTFLDLFGNPATNRKNHPLAPLGSLGQWRSGGTPPRSKREYFEGNVPWFSSGELGEMLVSRSNESISLTALAETAAKKVSRGSIMVGMYDTAALKTSIADIDCSCNQAIAFASINPELADTIYIYFALRTGRDHFRRLQRGARQKNLNIGMIREIAIPLPPMRLQKEFRERVVNTERLKEGHRQSLAELDALFASLQERAFRGAL
ncbi:type I restriction enzyme, S subunit [Micromonospora echinofusca]|uniref:Type I restriction enzyme, S subunit n=1 Tax=Micromonospora echinofusca TaxID=47858 RepID=A0A1C5G7M3_MICEH|nr:restriction endonuclease subunit S [Micromonospora echinofusca]SCG15046.1 type I restriction enzyme, S subunit [Micromonospora echinofusca]